MHPFKKCSTFSWSLLNMWTSVCVWWWSKIHINSICTQNPVSALELEGVFAPAEVVDEVAKLVDLLQALRHHHLLMDQVGLRQVGASLHRKTQQRYQKTMFSIHSFTRDRVINTTIMATWSLSSTIFHMKSHKNIHFKKKLTISGTTSVSEESKTN